MFHVSVDGCYSVIRLYSTEERDTRFPLQARSGTDGSRKLRFSEFMTTAQDGGKVVSLTHRLPLPHEILLVLISVRDRIDPRAIVRSEGFYANEGFQ